MLALLASTVKDYRPLNLLKLLTLPFPHQLYRTIRPVSTQKVQIVKIKWIKRIFALDSTWKAMYNKNNKFH